MLKEKAIALLKVRPVVAISMLRHMPLRVLEWNEKVGMAG